MKLYLPPPPSPNAIWRAVSGRMIKSAEYRAWIERAGREINRQQPKAIAGPVMVQITAEENNRRDLDGYPKAILDLLCEHQLIDGDRCKTVRSIYLSWSDAIEGVQIRVTSMQLMGAE